MGQKPLTFFRQVLALCDLPADQGIDHPDIAKIFPSDAIQRARQLREAIGPSGTGSYTNSQGILQFRKNIAKFIEKRDGHPAYAGNIFLTNGAVSATPCFRDFKVSSQHPLFDVPCIHSLVPLT